MPTHAGNTDLSQPAAAVSLSSILNVSISLLMRQADRKVLLSPTQCECVVVVSFYSTLYRLGFSLFDLKVIP
jgi:hypothetical protein